MEYAKSLKEDLERLEVLCREDSEFINYKKVSDRIDEYKELLKKLHIESLYKQWYKEL